MNKLVKTLIVFSVILCGCTIKHTPKFQPSASEEKLMREYYGKPYLDAPKGWHWACSQYDESDKCYIVKN